MNEPANDTDEDFFRDFMAKTEANIEKYGHSGIQILGDTPDETYTYSVGLGDAGWPELIVVALHPQTALTMINEVVAKLRSEERRPEAGMTITEAMNVPLKLHEVPFDVVLDHFKVALRRANMKGLPDESVTGLQIVWPDAKGLFPGDKGYDSRNFPQRILEDQ